MKIKKLIIRNLGIYYGKREIDLSTVENPNRLLRPIILFGGLNGAGKTTLFDSIKLCLYGKEMFPKMSVAAYHDYLAKKIHHSDSLDISPTDASVALEFEYSHFGEVSTYMIERLWEKNGKKTSERILIEKDGTRLEDVHEGAWQDFIKDLIPQGLSQLFFFDGEKIQNIIEDNNNSEFKDSFKMLLGLDIIERLQADLRIFKSRNLKNISSEKYKKEMEKLNSYRVPLEEKKNKIKASLCSIENDIRKIENDISKYRDKIAAQGGSFLEKKDTLTAERKYVEEELDTIKDAMREIASGLLPFAIADGYSKKFQQQIIKENIQQSNKIAEKILKSKKDAILQKVSSSDFFKNSKYELKDSVCRLLEKELDNMFMEEKAEDIEEIFGFSPSQTEFLVSLLKRAVEKTPKNLKSLSEEYEGKYRKNQKIVGDLKKVPDEEFVRPMYEKLMELNLKLGGLLNEKSRFANEISALDKEIAEIDRKLSHIDRQVEETKKDERKLELTNKADKVLSVYKRKLGLRKIEMLKKEFLSIFSNLHRKKGLIKDISIDSESLDITLYDRVNDVITMDSLSAGEKEIYAIALLTALARISGQNLPFIIDMPLGRLDSIHRAHIVEKFFPQASHQMIIFSTNTEIDDQYFKMLKPTISRCYNLEYEQENKSTNVMEGYFWN